MFVSTSWVRIFDPETNDRNGLTFKSVSHRTRWRYLNVQHKISISFSCFLFHVLDEGQISKDIVLRKGTYFHVQGQETCTSRMPGKNSGLAFVWLFQSCKTNIWTHCLEEATLFPLPSPGLGILPQSNAKSNSSKPSGSEGWIRCWPSCHVQYKDLKTFKVDMYTDSDLLYQLNTKSNSIQSWG